MPPNLALKAMNIAHRGLLRASGGKLGNSFSGMPSLELTTTGRKSGRPHTVMLTAPLTEGEAIVVVASRGGDPVHPAWYLNLLNRPEVDVSFRSGPRQPMTARPATAAERAEMWPKVIARFDGYAAYQRRTTREIPLVLLYPRS